jgi:hypothetical protein
MSNTTNTLSFAIAQACTRQDDAFNFKKLSALMEEFTTSLYAQIHDDAELSVDTLKGHVQSSLQKVYGAKPDSGKTGKKKRAANAYMIWCSEYRAQAKAEHPEASLAELSKILGDHWADMTEEEKAPYVEKAAKAKADAEAEETSGKPKREHKPRAENAYMIWSNEYRADFKTENPDASTPQLAKIMGAAWAEMTEEDKAPYVAKSAAAKAALEEAVKNGTYVKPEKKKYAAAKKPKASSSSTSTSSGSESVLSSPSSSIKSPSTSNKSDSDKPKSKASKQAPTAAPTTPASSSNKTNPGTNAPKKGSKK